MFFSRLQILTLTLLALSITLNLAILATAGRTLSVWNSQHHTNIWFLPLWPNHFDLRELATLLGTAACIVVLNVLLGTTLLLPSLFMLRARDLVALLAAGLSVAVSIVAVAFPAALTLQAPGRDTLQTWTCRWSGASASPVAAGQGSPSGFGKLCAETRFALFTTIPVLVLQLTLLVMAVYATFVANRSATRLHDTEKDGHALDDFHRNGFGSRTEINAGVHGDKVRILDDKV